MELREHFEGSGQWLFRWRSYLPLALLIPLAVAVVEYRWPSGQEDLQPIWEVICLAVSAAGMLVRVLVAGHVPKRTSGRNTRVQKADVLNTTGMYSVCRHPLYLGNFLVALGWSMFFLNGWLVAVYVMAFWLYYERIMMTEEAFLRERFGNQFRAWAAKTSAFLPRWKNWRRAELPFCWQTALRREYLTVTLVVFGFTALKLTQHWRVEQRLILEPFWIVLFGAALCVFVVMWILTVPFRVLYQPGR